jgi:hypothetical protein
VHTPNEASCCIFLWIKGQLSTTVVLISLLLLLLLQVADQVMWQAASFPQ